MTGPSSVSPGTWRWLTLAAILPVEILLLTLTFEPSNLASTPGWLAALLANSSIVLRVAIAMAGTLILVTSPRAFEVLGLLRENPQRYRVEWIVFQVIAFSALFEQTDRLFRDDSPTPEFLPVALWIVLCIAVAAAWGLAIAPAKAWRRFAVSHRSAIAVSVVAGLAAWAFGLAVQQFWRPLAQATLFFANGILQQMYGDVAFDLAAGTVGTPNLVIEIAPQCSGVEGIALVTVFVAVYLWLFRDRIAFPRSLWLFPAGIVAIWFANVLRIVAILAVGTSISPAIAVQGFHSQAGWIAFTAIALGLVGISHRYGLALTEGNRRMLAPRTSAPALLVPLMATLAVSMVTAAFSSGFDALYPVGVVVTALVLRHYRASYRALEFKPSLMPVAIGVAVFAAWIALRSQVSSGAGPAAHLPELPAAIALAWIVFRVIGSVVTVPIAEELAFRGYLLRKLVASDFEKVPPDRFTWLSFIGSSVLFGLMHQSWLAGTVAGAGFALAMYHRGRVTDAIVAHMTANALVAVCVLVFGYWDLWL